MTTIETVTKCLRIEALALRYYLDSHYGLSLGDFKEILGQRDISLTDFVLKSKSILTSAKWILEDEEKTTNEATTNTET